MVIDVEKLYICIDLKSFYASVECVERKLEPLNTNLVVADETRTDKTVCLAVSPSLKQYGIGGRARLFEVKQKIEEINYQRRKLNNYKNFIGKSYFDNELKNNKELELDLIIAPPRMAYYMKYSTDIYNIYLKYIAPEDILVYSIDEVFIDATHYLKNLDIHPKDFAKMIIQDIYNTFKITATAGIGTNLYLCKVAMDIVAKHIKPDQDGVRIASLNEKMYRKYLWNHQPITDFWRVGRGYKQKLQEVGLYTMGDIAKCSVGKADDYYNEELLYDMFGVNAELLIDHAWGYEPCTMKDIKSYKPKHNSIGSGQVLSCPYDFKKGRLVLKEMLDSLALDLVDRHLVTDQIVVTVGYDRDNLTNNYSGALMDDRYGRKIPKHGHGTINLECYTSSSIIIREKVLEWYDQKINKSLTIRRFNLSANHVIDESTIEHQESFMQMDMFTDYDQLLLQEKQLQAKLEKEKKLQETTLALKKKFGKNAVLKGMNLEEGATGRQRNKTIGGHKA